jgi:hypothetical protein
MFVTRYFMVLSLRPDLVHTVSHIGAAIRILTVDDIDNA